MRAHRIRQKAIRGTITPPDVETTLRMIVASLAWGTRHNKHFFLKPQQLLFLAKCVGPNLVVLLDQCADFLVHDVDCLHAHSSSKLLLPWVLENAELRDKRLVLITEGGDTPLVPFDLRTRGLL